MYTSNTWPNLKEMAALTTEPPSCFEQYDISLGYIFL